MSRTSSTGPKSSRLPLSRERVLQAALELIDRDGEGALTMRSLASDLGVEAPSIYKHVASKDAILDGVCELIYGEVVIDAVGNDWEERLRAYTDGFRRVLLRHRNAVPIVATRAVATTGSMFLVEVALTEFARVGFDAETARRLLNVVVATVIGMTLAEISDQDSARELLADPLRFPLASATVAASPADRVAEFELAMSILANGIRELIPA